MFLGKSDVNSVELHKKYGSLLRKDFPIVEDGQSKLGVPKPTLFALSLSKEKLSDSPAVCFLFA